MYTRYFGLKENPFSIAPDPRFLYLSRRHQEALAHLIYGVTEGGGFVQLAGNVGTGKTMLIRALLERLPDTVELALILYPLLSVREFMGAICDELRIPYSKTDSSLKDMIDALNDYVLANFAKGRRTVLIIDEAQNLNRDVLEQLRLLTNLETSKEKLLQILLVGQPELNSLLAQEDMRQLAQRVTARYSLGSLFAHETSEYILHRCLVAGAKTPLFSVAAMRWVHSLSGGVPRVINIICDRALLGTYARGRAYANVSLVRRAAAQVGQPIPKRYLTRPATLAAGAIAAALILLGWQFSPMFKKDAENNQVASLQSVEIDGGDVSAGLSAIAADTEPTPEPGNGALDQRPTVASIGKQNHPTLEQLLANPNTPTDTESAFAALFSRWDLDYSELRGATGCARAQNAGLRCILHSGTWNNLRQLNRPAVIELLDENGQRHHVLVSALSGNRVLSNLGDREYGFPISEIDRYWYGRYLLLWKPLSPEQRVLRRGMRGSSVIWLRNTLAQYAGEPADASDNDLFDRDLEAQVKAFQRDHQLAADGVVGRLTLIQLNTYDADKAPPVLWKAAERKTG